MGLAIGSVVLEAADVRAAARFWCAVLGYAPRDAWADDFMVLARPGAPWANLSLQANDEPKRGANRVHLDLYADDQAAEVARIERLGGTRVRDWPYPEDADFVVMRDLDGNEFCVVQKG
jgi:catechol 2,3-dioxygenase-like lactoylglutathione lyase family enzyme